ncbi:MAG TPA: ABC transporter ATP-binding protein [Verrucomicrobiae bacterium]|nr:ABC transporter ATP-binding protein [Verrucomicrobiae bacterium]
MARVFVHNLTKTFAPGVTPVRSVSFEVEDKGFLTLLGPSGCGKSTILRMIAGLETVTDGEIFIGERRVNHVHPSDRDIAMVFQSYALYPHMTVYENIAVNLRLREISASEIQHRVKETARLLDIEALLDRKPRALSGGQRQRVALGRAIIRKPKAFLLDEPLSNLDAILRERMRAELKRLFADLGATVIYVTHDQTEAMTMSSRIAVIYNARVQQLGTPEEIYHQPANVFVANFVGSPRINILKCRVTEDGLKLGNQKIPLSRSRLETLQGQKEVLVGVRPENMRVGQGTLTGKVEVIEPLGAFTVLNVRVEGQKLQVLVEPHGDWSGAIPLQPDESRLHFFNSQTEEKL